MSDEERKDSPEEPDERKLHVDSDWKREAEEEKARLRDVESKEADSTGGGDRPPLPPPSLLHLVLSLSTQALISLGEIENPVSKKQETDLDQARFTIDLLEILQTKTKGNLTEEEAKTLEALLYDLRMKFVAASEPTGDAGPTVG